MNPDWRSFLASQGARFDAAGDLQDFGDAAAELTAARDGTVVVPLAHLGLIACSGDDAQTFLQNQLTNDINHLPADGARHAAWCTAKGRMLASFVVCRSATGFELCVSADLAAPTVKRLQMFVLRSKVTLADLGDAVALIGVAGERAADALAAAGLPMPEAPLGTAVTDGIRVVRLDAGRFTIAVAAEAAPAVWAKLAEAARPAGLPAWRWLDIRAGLPLVTAATKEEFVPQMADFDRIGGISFNKGCYPGQEIVARTHYLGKVKRHLYRVRAGAEMAAGDDLQSPDSPDHPCGKLVTAAPSPAGGWEALAVLQENFATGEVRLRTPDGLVVGVEAVAA